MYQRLALLLVMSGAVAAFGQFATAGQSGPAADQAGQNAQATPQGQGAAQPAFKQREEAAAGPYQIAAGTHVLLSMINSVSTKQAQPGDRIYLETAFPVLAGTRIVIPQGSWVTGTVLEVKRPGRAR